MKRRILFGLLFLCSLGAGAQGEIPAPPEKSGGKIFDSRIADRQVVFGIRGGVNFNSFGSDVARVWDSPVAARTDVGWNVGFVFDVPILESFYFQAGAFYKTKGFQLAGSDAEHIRRIKGKGHFLQFPLLFSYRYKVKEGFQLEFNAGPYIAAGLSGNVTDYVYKKGKASGTSGLNPDYVGYEDPVVTRRDMFGDDLESSFGLKKTDVGLSLGAGMTVNRFYLGFQYDLGLMNLRNDACWGEKASFRTGSATILLGFNLFRY